MHTGGQRGEGPALNAQGLGSQNSSSAAGVRFACRKTPRPHQEAWLTSHPFTPSLLFLPPSPSPLLLPLAAGDWAPLLLELVPQPINIKSHRLLNSADQHWHSRWPRWWHQTSQAQGWLWPRRRPTCLQEGKGKPQGGDAVPQSKRGLEQLLRGAGRAL